MHERREGIGAEHDRRRERDGGDRHHVRTPQHDEPRQRDRAAVEAAGVLEFGHAVRSAGQQLGQAHEHRRRRQHARDDRDAVRHAARREAEDRHDGHERELGHPYARHSQHVRDLAHFEPLVEAQLHHVSQLRGERVNQRIHLAAPDRHRRVGVGRAVGHVYVERPDGKPPRPRGVDAEVARDGEQVRERLAVARRAPAAHETQERLLRHVRRVVVGRSMPPAVRQHVVVMLFDQAIERLAVSQPVLQAPLHLLYPL